MLERIYKLTAIYENAMELLFELAALFISLGGLLHVFLKERTKLLTEIGVMQKAVKDLEDNDVKREGKLIALENRQVDDRQAINELAIKDNFYEMQMKEVRGSIETLHTRINSSEKNILKEMKEAIRELKADLK